MPPRVEYALTGAGQRLRDIIGHLDAWGSWYRQHLKSQVRDDDQTPTET
ncbi:winged helix-turn-helix transcriptional regulator [Streptomyces sioyaensis]